MYSTKSGRLSGEEKLTEKSVDEDFHSNSETQTIISQRDHPNIVECKSSLMSINKHKNNHPVAFMIEKTETEQIEKYKNDRTASNINDEVTQNNSKGDNTLICIEKTDQALKEVINPTKKSLEKLKKRKRMFSLLDILISLSIIGPLAIGFWRGVWSWMDFHAQLFPDWFCFTFGAALHVGYAFFKDQFHDNYTNKWAELNWRKRLPYRALRIMYIHTFGVACIMHWRGGWIFIDDYLFNRNVWIITSLTCSLLVCLVVLRCVRNLIAIPLIILIDKPSCVFQFPTRYKMVSYKFNRFSFLSTYYDKEYFTYNVFCANIFKYP